ncbi:MAG: DNA repair protein RecN [Chloroflexi bacterium]|nr:DNA repair protein RecN [Chloroflexota bacterium]
MLLELAIHDFAIIDSLQIGFGPGFTALTGETGAGKSIIIDALGAVLGARAGSELVRGGRPVAHVEAIFDLSGQVAEPLATLLAEQGIEPEDGTLILSRDIAAGGRSVARVNGRAVTTGVLQQIGQTLVDIHGQSDHLSLLRPASHIGLLDEYGALTDERTAVGQLVAELRGLRAELATLERDERALAARVDLLTFQVAEIEAAALRPDEEELLATERARLANAERLTLLAETLYRALHGGEGRGGRGALDALREAITAAEPLAQLDPTRQSAAEALAETFYLLEDTAHEARAYRDSVEHDPTRLEQIDDRLQALRDLKRKYGATLAEVIAYGAAAAAELATLTHRDERVAALRAGEEQLLAEIGQQAAALSAARQAAGERLAAAIETAMLALNMGRARFAVSLTRQLDATGVPLPPDGTAVETQRYAFDTRGIDRVEFLISPNPGEPLKPLARIASGGETARLMLALKSILAAADATPTLVFDEIDVGVGGRSGQVVGEKLWGLTADGGHQVICITHLPQIAAFAETHYKITKHQQADHTTTAVVPLDEAGRVEELAAMLGGLPITGPALANAAALLERVRAGRQSPVVSRQWSQ